MMNKHRLTSPFLAIPVALLLLAVAFVGYQVVSAQTFLGTVDDDPPAAPTGLTATHDGAGVLLEWDDPADDTISGYRIWRRYHRDSHEDASRPPVDDEMQLHVRHTGSPENHFHDSDFVELETVYGYAVAAIGADGAEGAISEEATVTTPDASGEAPEEIEGVKACMRSPAMTLPGERITSADLYFKKGHLWNPGQDDNGSGCSEMLQWALHESGHAFGFGTVTKHATARDSIMRATVPDFCGPKPYDIVAMMALYQLR